MKILWKQHLNEIHYCELPPIIFYVKLSKSSLILIDFELLLLYKHYSSKTFSNKSIAKEICRLKQHLIKLTLKKCKYYKENAKFIQNVSETVKAYFQPIQKISSKTILIFN